MIMAIIRYLIFLPFNLFFVLSAFVLSPVLAGFSVLFGMTTLPGFLQWWSTLDDTLDGGQHQHPDLYTPGARHIKLWWQRTCWICRNPAHGWQTRLLGFPTAGHAVVFTRMKTEGIQSDGKYFTIKTIMKDARGKTYFSYRADKRLVFGLSVKIWLGWNPSAYDGIAHQYEFQPFSLQRL